MEAADADRQAGSQELPGEIDGARKLVRLDADEADECAAAFPADHADNRLGPHAPVRLVVGVEADFDVRAQHLAPAGVSASPFRQASVLEGMAERTPLDRIAVVIVMVGLTITKWNTVALPPAVEVGVMTAGVRIEQ